MCQLKPDCRICPAFGPCAPACGLCNNWRRVVVVDPAAYKKFHGHAADPDAVQIEIDGRTVEGSRRAQQNKERKMKPQSRRRSRDFKAEGEGSRIWWLSLIHGGASGIYKLMKEAKVSYALAQAILEKLLDEGLINAADDSSYRKTYTLTDKGYDMTGLPKPPSVTYPVPEYPTAELEALPQSSTEEPEKPAKTPVEVKKHFRTGNRITEITVGPNIKITITEPA